MEGKQFSVKQLSAALSGVLVLFLVTSLTIEEINCTLGWALFFAALSLPALVAMPILDDIMDKENKITDFNAFSIACFVGTGSFLLCLSTLFFNYSMIVGITLFVGTLIWLYVVTNTKKKLKHGSITFPKQVKKERGVCTKSR